MTQFNYREFYEGQIEWYKKEIEWCTEQIEWYTRQLERCREEDREFVEWVQQNPNYTDEEKANVAKWVPKETKANLAMRKRYYRSRKNARARLARYERELANLN
jgi:hypothetical protein